MSNQMIQKAENAILHTYNRFQVVFDKGEGVYLYDTDGKQYLDFASGIGVQSLGYGNEEYKQALKDQIDKLTHISNLYYSNPMAEAADKLVKATGMSRVFFTNSGMGALSVTGNPKYQEAFKPMIGHVKFADFNNLESVKALVNEKTCAIIMETIQGEGGIYPVTEEFLKGVRAICDENDILLVLDEIQCGMGRSGYMFAWQEYGVEPDIMTCAKALGCGVPVGAFVLNEKTAVKTLVPGDHGTTYGGNPFVCAAVSKVLDIFEKDKIVEHVKEISVYLEERLDALVEEYDFLETRRGKGLMQGLVVSGRPVGEIVQKALENGLVVISAGSNVLRMLPPLVIEKEHVDEMIEKLKKCF